MNNRHLKVANLVRELRHHLDLSQEKFAARLGVSIRTVNRWENAQATPSPLAMEKIEGMLRENSSSPSAPIVLS